MLQPGSYFNSGSVRQIPCGTVKIQSIKTVLACCSKRSKYRAALARMQWPNLPAAIRGGPAQLAQGQGFGDSCVGDRQVVRNVLQLGTISCFHLLGYSASRHDTTNFELKSHEYPSHPAPDYNNQSPLRGEVDRYLTPSALKPYAIVHAARLTTQSSSQLSCYSRPAAHHDYQQYAQPYNLD